MASLDDLLRPAPSGSDGPHDADASELPAAGPVAETDSDAEAESAVQSAAESAESTASDSTFDSTVSESADAGSTAGGPRTHRRTALRKRRNWLIAAAAVVLVIAAVGGTLLALLKSVTVTVDGEARSVTTLAGTVAGALDAAGVTVGEHDTLAPAADTDVSDGGTIVLNRGRLLTLTVDGQSVQVWTTARTVEDALAGLGRDPGDYALSADRSRAIPLDGFEVEALTKHTVTVVDGSTSTTYSVTSTTVRSLLQSQGIVLAPNQVVTPGLDSAVTGDTRLTISTLPTVTIADGTRPGFPVISAATSISDLLTQAGITLTGSDTVSVPLDSAPADGLQIVVTRIGTSEVTQTEVIPQPDDQKVNDSTRDKGTTEITQQGRPGEATVVYAVVTTNGVETGRTETSRTVTVEAQPTIIAVGTKVAAPVPTAVTSTPTPSTPAPTPTTEQPAPATTTTPPPSGGTEYVGNLVYFHDFEFGVDWDGLAGCESGHNPRAINPSGKYTGLFQFDDSTWRSVGGSGRAYDAGPDEQLMRAKMLFQSRGLGPWACAYAA